MIGIISAGITAARIASKGSCTVGGDIARRKPAVLRTDWAHDAEPLNFPLSSDGTPRFCFIIDLIDICY